MKKLIISLIVLSIFILSLTSAEMQLEEYECGDSFTMYEGDTVSVLGKEVELSGASTRDLILSADGNNFYFSKQSSIQNYGSFFPID